MTLDEAMDCAGASDWSAASVLAAEVTRLRAVERSLRAELAEQAGRMSRHIGDYNRLANTTRLDRAALDWYRTRESLFIRSTEYLASDLAAWESLNPKPENVDG